jgi:DNA-binding FadR family transcriptional regulator
MLESEGMIRVTRGSRGGAKVLLPPLRSIARDLGVYLQMRDVELGDLYAALLTYEPVAARSIARRRDPAALSALAQCVAAQEFSTHDREAYNAHERRFRQLLLQWCGNEVIHAMGALLSEVYERSMRHATTDLSSPAWEAEHLTSGVAAKRRLVRLMADGQAVKAERAWRAYLTIYWRRVAAQVGRHRRVHAYSKDLPPPAPDAPGGGRDS